MYSLSNVRILVPVKLDQSAKADGDVIFTWLPAKRIEIVDLGFVVSEVWGETDSKVSLKIAGEEKAVVKIIGGTVLGKEPHAGLELPIWVEKDTKLEFVAKDVANEAGEGYFVLEYRELP